MTAEDNFFTNELSQYYLSKGQNLSQSIIEVLNKPAHELSKDEVNTYKNVVSLLAR